MRRKPRVGIDLRDVAIYTRKSKLTHMGDSTGIQMKQSADFARSQLNLPEDYCFLEYEDKGLSGYYADRPDFQRMLHDIEAGKIRAVVCYKLDRISRKTSDLLRLIDFFNKHDVALLVCSNNINTLISTSKIMISFLAIIAEFERDIIAERIADNLIELAKDGRWMGGCTPTGFKAIRNTIGSGKNKTSITHLEPIPDEKKMVQQIFKTFRQCRSINKTATTIGEDYKTKFGKEHTSLSIKDILSNPIYCTADEISFDYFYQKNGNICSDEKDFDAIHGIMAYNKTDQERLEDEESTFMNRNLFRFVRTSRLPSGLFLSVSMRVLFRVLNGLKRRSFLKRLPINTTDLTERPMLCLADLSTVQFAAADCVSCQNPIVGRMVNHVSNMAVRKGEGKRNATLNPLTEIVLMIL